MLDRRFIFSLLLFITTCFSAFGQQNHEYIFFSNVDDLNQIDYVIDQTSDSSEQTWISMGDNKSTVLLKLKQKYPKSEHIYLLGDQHQLLLENNDILQKGTQTNIACPEPLVKHITEHSVLITINSAWFLEQDFRVLSSDQSCDYYNEIQLIESLESIIEDYPDHQKIIVAHHGIHSFSEIAGRGLGIYNLIPIYGQLYNGFRSNVGKKGDLAQKKYQRYISLINGFLQKQTNVVFVSGHDYLNFINKENALIHLNVNSGTKTSRYAKSENVDFVSELPSVLRISNAKNQLIISFESKDENYVNKNLLNVETYSKPSKDVKRSQTKVLQTVAASTKYKQGKLKTTFFGKGYRNEWATVVGADVLNLNEYDGGLLPYAIGGGLQTKSIKFKSENGKKYAFRMLDKQPERSLTDAFKESIYKNIIVELITTMHPYSPLVADHLLEQTDILHIKPKLFVLNDHKSLIGEYAEFVGKLGTLELKPKGKKKDREGFAGADDVLDSYEMLARLHSSHNHKLDKKAYARARLMDMYLGDWDRHEGNWKWALFEDGKHETFKPIPKDRDHVFSKWSGILPGIADKVISNAEDFDYAFGNVRHLNFKGRFLDRELSSELSKKDWMNAATYLQNAITIESINDAVNKIPEEVRTFSGDEIKEKLISRKEDLPNLVDKYYAELNPYVDIVGTNQKDKFTITSIDKDNLLVEIYHQDEVNPYLQRVIECNEIKDVHLYGLADNDVFLVDCNAEHRTGVKIIGGEGQDQIGLINKDFVPKIKVYDSHKEDSIEEHKNIKVRRPERIPHYDPYAFDYNLLSPIGSIKSSSGNGFGFGIGATYFIRGFNKPNYASKVSFKTVVFPGLGIFRFDFDYVRKNFFKWLDLDISARRSTLYDKFPFFYGLGNNSEFISPSKTSSNRIDYNILDVSIGAVKHYPGGSSWKNSIGFERHNIDNFDDNQAIDDINLQGFGVEQYLTYNSEFHLDFTDNKFYPTDGAIFKTNVLGRYNSNNNFTGNIDTRFSYYESFRLGVLVTLVGSINYKKAFGNAAFYHQSILGSQTNFRGFDRNRFIDENGLLLNADLRVKLGTIQTPLFPLVSGIFFLYDNGKVWNERSEFRTNDWHTSIGGGFYLAPVNEEYSIKFTLATSDDRSIYTQLQLGLDF